MESRAVFVSGPSACRYLADQTWRIEYELVGQVSREEYLERLQSGWRRFGYTLFRPVCRSCRQCQSLRIPVERFRPDRSQRRAWKANHATMTIVVGTPTVSAAKRALFTRFHEHQSESKGWLPQDEDVIESFVENPFATEEWSYYAGDRLVAVGYVDRLPDALSAIYFYYDPDERHRSLGTFNVLAILDAAREQRIPYVYLGYYVEGCRSLEYKARFRANEVLRPDGTWKTFLS
jgi:arginine-tRNA-protein transferase